MSDAGVVGGDDDFMADRVRSSGAEKGGVNAPSPAVTSSEFDVEGEEMK
jgi:hypothetical protein